MDMGRREGRRGKGEGVRGEGGDRGGENGTVEKRTLRAQLANVMTRSGCDDEEI